MRGLRVDCKWAIFGLMEVAMRMSSQIRPISYLKANAAEIIRILRDQEEPLIITQNGEAKAVVQDIDSYEQTQENFGSAQDSSARQSAD